MSTEPTQYILIAVADSTIAAQLKEGIESSCGTPCLIGVSSSEAFCLASQNSDQITLAILDTALTDISESLLCVTAEQSIPTLLLSDNYTEACTSCAMSPTIIDAVLKNRDLVSNVIEVVQRLHQNKNTHVLIVNSSASIRHFLSYVVSNYMLNPKIARTGKEALCLLEKQNFPLVLIDAYLDDMPGVELTRLIRKHHPPEHTSIIGISGNSDMHISAMFLKSGASDFLNKPFKREELYCRMIQNLKVTELLHHLEQLNVLKNKMLGMLLMTSSHQSPALKDWHPFSKKAMQAALRQNKKKSHWQFPQQVVPCSHSSLTCLTFQLLKVAICPLKKNR